MSTTNNDGPAFPFPGDLGNGADRGMSLRDYFAGQVLLGTIASAYRDCAFNNQEARTEIAEWAYRFADTMLAAREKQAPAVDAAPVARVEPKTWAVGTRPPVAGGQVRRDAVSVYRVLRVYDRHVTARREGLPHDSEWALVDVDNDPLAEPWTEPTEVTP